MSEFFLPDNVIIPPWVDKLKEFVSSAWCYVDIVDALTFDILISFPTRQDFQNNRSFIKSLIFNHCLNDNLKNIVREGDTLLYKTMLTSSEGKIKSERVKIIRKINTLCGRLEFETYPSITPTVAIGATPTVIDATPTVAIDATPTVIDATPTVAIDATPTVIDATTTVIDATTTVIDATPTVIDATLTLKRKRDDEDENIMLQKAIYYGRKSDEYFDRIFNESAFNAYSSFKKSVNETCPRILVVGDKELYLKMISSGNDYVLYRDDTTNLPLHDFIIVKEGITIDDELIEEEYV
jgi:hypothetical protein